MCISRKGNSKVKLLLSIVNELVEQVKQFMYLLGLIYEDGYCETDKKRIASRKMTFMAKNSLLIGNFYQDLET